MSHRKRVIADKTSLANVQYQNLFAQLIALVMPRRLFAVLGRGSAKTTDVQVERLIDFAKANGGIEYAERRMMDYHDKAIEALDPLPDSPAKKALVDLADYIVYREK